MTATSAPDSIRHRRRATWLAALALLLAPLLLLAPCVLGSRTFVPYDLAQFPPVSTKLTDAQLAEVKADQNMDVTEVPVTFLPEMRFTQQELAAGRLPEWNAYARGGAPLLATSVVGLMYPPNWLYLAAGDPADGLAFGCWLSLAIAGLLAFGLLRSLGLDVPAALFGGLAFAFSGTLYANAHFYMRLSALIWLPGMLWAGLGMARRRGWSRVPPMVALTVCTTLSWLAGFPAYAAGALLVVGLVSAGLIVQDWRQHGAGSALGLAGSYGAAVVLAFALAGVQLVPMFAFFPESNRTVAPPPDDVALHSFDPAALLGYLMPDPFGHPTRTSALSYAYNPLVCTLFDRRSWTTGKPFLPPTYNYTEFTVFAGTLPLLLALGSALFAGIRLRLLLIGTYLFVLLLALAPAALAPLYGLPGMRNVYPMRLLAPCSLLVAALAAIALHHLGRGAPTRKLLGLVGLGAALAAVTGAGWLWLGGQEPSALLDRIRQPLLEYYRQANPGLTAAAVDAAMHGKMAPARDQLLGNLRYATLALGLATALLAARVVADRWRHGVAVWRGAVIAATLGQLVVLAHGVAGGRVLRYPIDSDVHAFLRRERDAWAERGGFTVARGATTPKLAVTLPPCTLVPEHIRDLDIYTFVDKRSHLPFVRRWGPQQMAREYWINALPDDDRLQSPYLDLLGVRFVISDTVMHHAGREVGPPWRGPQGEVRVYERDSALPRAFTVPALRQLADEDAVVTALVAEDFDPLAAALVTPDQAAALPALAAPAAPERRDVRFVRDVPNDIHLAIGDGGPAYLVLTDTYMSGWTVTVGGEPAAMARGDLCQRVVALPAGPVDVHFHYRTPRLLLGAVVSALALGVLGVILLGWWRRRRAVSPAVS